ncbi:cytochrome P450 [Lentzea sp. NPDC051838]|uniref:cytochrome P450 family protein n=1 Tax=Lentzea sp. NPDC051838 TaxID=3154849 RepID=UPI00343A2924
MTAALTNPFHADFARDPYGAYQLLLDAGPVSRVEVAPGLHAWLVCGYQESRDLLVDPRMSIEPASTREDVRALMLGLQTEEKQSLYGRHLLATDPPRHSQLRKVMSRALTARRLGALRPEVSRISDDLLDSLSGSADLLGDYALPLTIRVLAELIGLPSGGAEVFERLGGKVLRGEVEHDQVFFEVIGSLSDYLGELVKDPGNREGDGLLALLLQAFDRGEIVDEELNSLLFQLFFAGHESTGYFIANAMATLLHHRTLFDGVREDPSTVDRVVEELLRFEGSVKSATWRFPTEDVTVAGTTIAAGDPVLIIFAAADRDPARFADPQKLDPVRGGEGHLAFGHGPHHCLGNALGRMEAAVAITSLTTRFPEMKLAVPYERLPWRQNMVMRGMRALPVVLS